MTMITEFADQLYTFMAMKYRILCSGFPPVEDVPIELYDWSASDEFTVEIGHAVLMLSYTYRSEFRKHFQILKPVLTSSKAKANVYPLVFAKVTYTEHSPLKILVLCAFISEMYLFLLFNSKSKHTILDYIKPSTECFNTVYRAVLSIIDDPILKWKDLKRVAALLASGYHLLQPLMETEHPSDSVHFFQSIQLLKDAAKRQPEGQAVHEAAEVHDQVVESRKMKANEELYNTLKSQSHRLFPPLQALGTAKLRQKSLNENSTLGASCSVRILESDNKDLKTETHGNVEKTNSDLKSRALMRKRPTRQSRLREKIAAAKAAASAALKDAEADPPRPKNPNPEELIVRLFGGMGSEKLSSLIVRDNSTDDEVDDEPKGQESIV